MVSTILMVSYRNKSGFSQYATALYHYGLLYFENRVDETQSLPDVFDRAPLTTEQLLHNETPASEPRTPLSVSVAGEESLSRYGTYTNRGTVGELFTRIALDQELGRERAIEAAAGWGDDTLTTVATDDGPGFVWVTRWDAAEDADQFEAAIEDFGDRRPETVTSGDRSLSTTFEVDRPSADVVVVYIGSESLSETLSADADGEHVTIDPRD